MQHIVDEIPPLCGSCRALLDSGVEQDHVAIATCRRCKDQYVRFLPGWVPGDETFVKYYGDNVDVLMWRFHHPLETAIQLARDYYFKFTDPAYCDSIGVPTQDEEFFFHEGKSLALRIHYYLALKGDPDPGEYIKWRSKNH